jgi:hypothetical protein
MPGTYVVLLSKEGLNSLSWRLPSSAFKVENTDFAFVVGRRLKNDV